MKLIKPALSALTALHHEKKHFELFAIINIFEPMQFPDAEESEEMGFDKGASMASCEFLGVSWLFFAKNGKIIDSDIDSI